MIKKIGILLLIFIAVVGLSSVSSATSLTQSASQRFTTAKSIDSNFPTVTSSFYYKIKTFTVTTSLSRYSFLANLRNHYPLPLYRVSIFRIPPFHTVMTTWRVTISKWRTV